MHDTLSPLFFKKMCIHFFFSSSDVALARVESEKRLAFVRAWEESEKAKVENK